MALPLFTSDEDVQRIVDYFKTKATGASIQEAKPILGKYLDPRKVNSYLRWKILKKEGDKLKLDDLGRQLSRTSEEGKKEIYSQIIRHLKAYNACLEWAFHRSYNVLSNVEVASFWYEHHASDAGSTESSIKDAAVTFFYICQAAGIGNLKIGRKGSPTRLEFNKTSLGQYIGESGLSNETEHDEFDENGNDNYSNGNGNESDKNEFQGSQLKTNGEEVKTITQKPIDKINHKVFISHSANKEIVDQIKTMLDLAGLEYEVAVDRESTAIPVPDKIFNAMRSSTSAIICVTADERLKNEDGTHSINQNVLIEIGAAFVLYDKKVVLVWDKRLTIPSNLQGLYRCEFQGDELTWSAGMKLMKAMAEFKK